MIDFIKQSIEDRILVINNTSEKMKVSNAIIEKDFWVCFMLQYLFTDFVDKDHICFKGGTSLSKAYGLINRFSEDIDIILESTVLGYEKKDVEQPRSNNQQDKFNKKIRSETQSYLADEWMEILDKELKSILGDTFKLTLEDDQVIAFNYPQLFVDNSLLQEIRLEVGPLAESTPFEYKVITPYISDYYPELFSNATINIKVVRSLRTLYEKLLIVHSEANRDDGDNYPSRYSRHFYDIYMCLHSSLREESLTNIELLEEVLEFKAKFYPSKRSRYDKVFISGLDLNLTETALGVFQKDYIEMQGMILGKPPTFDEISQFLSEYGKEINVEILKYIENKPSDEI